MKMNKKLYYLLMGLLTVIIAGCLAYLVIYYVSSKLADDKQKDLAELIVEVSTETTEETVSEESDEPVFQEKFRTLYEMNQDFVGWLTVPDTNIDYPVMQKLDDEEYYLRRDFEKKSSQAGMLFLDTECDVKKPTVNMMIYGHNMKSGKMFHDLLKYDDKEFYESHKYITFDTIYREGTYEVIAAFYTEISAKDARKFKYYTFFDADYAGPFDYFVQNAKALTPYETADAEFGDELITLSTCAYHVENGRYVVVAKKIK